MRQKYNSTSSRRGKHFNWEERLILERMNRKKGKDKMTIKQMATILDRHERSIRRELKRGAVMLRKSDLSEYEAYSPDIARRTARKELEAKGPELKLGADYELVKDIKGTSKKPHFVSGLIFSTATALSKCSRNPVTLRFCRLVSVKNLCARFQKRVF